jgi:hypothetical protein
LEIAESEYDSKVAADFGQKKTLGTHHRELLQAKNGGMDQQVHLNLQYMLVDEVTKILKVQIFTTPGIIIFPLGIYLGRFHCGLA